MDGCPNLKLTPMFDACTAQDDDGVMCAGPGRTNYARCYRYHRARVEALETELALWRRHTEGALGVLCDGYTCHSSTMPCPRADRGTCTASGDVTELSALMDAYDERQREATKGASDG